MQGVQQAAFSVKQRGDFITVGHLAISQYMAAFAYLHCHFLMHTGRAAEKSQFQPAGVKHPFQQPLQFIVQPVCVLLGTNQLPHYRQFVQERQPSLQQFTLFPAWLIQFHGSSQMFGGHNPHLAVSILKTVIWLLPDTGMEKPLQYVFCHVVIGCRKLPQWHS